MTRQEWKELTVIQKRVKVGEITGVYDTDYLNDLNAMHEAEKTLNPAQFGDYWPHLDSICEQDSKHMLYMRAIRATAAQRAEAFVLTMSQK